MENKDSLELEFKFGASDIKLQKFIKLMNEIGYIKRIDISSWDHYYSNGNLDEFVRFRNSTTPEMTKKAKLKESNNWKRVEYDLPLDPKRITKDVVDGYLKLEGYSHNVTLYKTCVIFFLDKTNYVYYHTYDENLNETGRFIEVEVNKDKVPELGTDKAFELLKESAKKLEVLGLTAQHRMKLSLWEQFRNDK